MNVRWKIAQYFESRWWRLYLSRKPADAYLTWKKKYWSAFADLAEISLSPEDRILDAGCGPAGIHMIFPDNPVTALDPLLDQYEQAFGYYRKTKGTASRFICQSLESYQTTEKFDRVFCLNAINHVSDIRKSLSKLEAVLEKQGKLYLSVDAHNFQWCKHVFRWVPGDILHPHQYELADYFRLLNEAGLQVDRTSLIDRGFLFNYYLIVASRLPANGRT